MLMTKGTTIIGVILVDHQRMAPHPGLSQMLLLKLSSMIVASTFAPSVTATIQLKRSSGVEKANVIIER